MMFETNKALLVMKKHDGLIKIHDFFADFVVPAVSRDLFISVQTLLY